MKFQLKVLALLLVACPSIQAMANCQNSWDYEYYQENGNDFFSVAAPSAEIGTDQTVTISFIVQEVSCQLHSDNSNEADFVAVSPTGYLLVETQSYVPSATQTNIMNLTSPLVVLNLPLSQILSADDLAAYNSGKQVEGDIRLRYSYDKQNASVDKETVMYTLLALKLQSSDVGKSSPATISVQTTEFNFNQ